MLRLTTLLSQNGAKVAITMHCTLRLSDVAPVILGFNYENNNAWLSNFNTIVYCTTEFIDHFAQFPARLQEAQHRHNSISQTDLDLTASNLGQDTNQPSLLPKSKKNR